MNKRALLMTFLACFVFLLHGQSADFNIDSKDLKTYVKILSSDSLDGRGIGTEGHMKASRFISDRFRQMGLSQFDDNGYYQKFTLHQTYWGEVYVETDKRKLENFSNMVFQGRFPILNETQKELVFAGTGTDDELKQIEIRDRLVLVFVGNLRSYFELNQRLSKGGAYGLIIANPDNENQFESIKNTLRDHYLSKKVVLPDQTQHEIPYLRLDTLKHLNTILISNSEIKSITGFSKRRLKGVIKENRLSDVPVSKVTIRAERVHETIETENVIGIIPGKTNKTIVISAHFDHLGRKDNVYFPGADDNASGIAALLELAEHFSEFNELQYNILFIATSGEESGLLGSTFYVNQPNFDPDNVLCNLNLDMISRVDDKHKDGNYLYCIGKGQSDELDMIINKADSLYDKCYFDYSLNNLNDPGGIFKRTDSFPFHSKGIPSIFFFSGMHADYHKITDTFDKINFKTLENRVRQIAIVVELLQTEGLGN
jgi:hypothetical protein